MTILLVGCGRMGGAMARAWRDRECVLALDPAASLPAGVERVTDLGSVTRPVDLVVLAVKPQAFGAIAPTLAPLCRNSPLLLSIMAGVSLATIAAALGQPTRVVRAMPNTPAAIGKGISGAVAGPDVDAGDRRQVDALLSSLGEVVWLDRETDLDRVTAVSGSGPAYFFRMAEALATAGTEAGLPPDVAMRLARTTLIGAGALADCDDTDLAELRRQVTSPGGTTAAGLAQMDEARRMDALMADVVAAAADRARDLAG